MRVLIVEDDVATAEFVREVLSETEHEIIGPAVDESGAWWRATGGIDLALVDLHLADGITGAHLAHEMRQMFGIQSIFMSGSPVECRLRAKESGALGCLHKPFSEHDLLSTVAIASGLLSGRLAENPPARLELYGYVV